MFKSLYKKTILGALLLSSTYIVLPVCPEMEVWSDGTNYRYLIKDLHRDYIDGRTSIKQQADILWAVQQNKVRDVFVLVEDTSTYSSNNPKMQRIFEHSPSTIEEDIALIQDREEKDPKEAVDSMDLFDAFATPLACMIKKCEKLGIPNYNTECSQAINVFQWKHVPESDKISVDEVIQDLSDAIEEIKNDKLLAAYYALLKKKLEELKAVILTSDEAFVAQAMEIRGILVNARTIHKLIEWNGIKHGFICEGTLHIEAIKDGLQALGYRCIQSIGDADVWTPPQTEEEFEEKTKHVVSKALNLRETFQQIFDKQPKEHQLSLWNYKLPIAIGIGLIGAVATWFYWKK